MNVPKLRFKEFNDEYETYTINELGNVITGTTPSTNDKENYGNEFLWASPIDLGIHKYIDNTKNKLSEKGFKKVRAIPKDSVLITCIGSTIGKMGMASKVMATNQQINTLICNNNFDNNYMYYCIGYNFPKFLSKISFQAVPIISKSEFEKLSLNCSTNKQEQIKVADFHSLLDKKIELQTKKIEDLKLFKLCINNNLFNGNKTIKLKDICECKSSTISLSDIEYDNGIYPIYGANGEIKKINSYQHGKEYLAIIKDGAGVGKTIICNKKSSIIATLNALIPNDIPVYYFNELINKIDFSKYIVGSGIPHIYFKDYSNEKLYLHDEKERLLINNLFEKIIIKIELEENKLHLLEALKKGLMQNMFV